MYKISTFFLVLLTFFSCENPTIERKEIWAMAQKAEPTISMMVMDKNYPTVECPIYGAGCEYTFRIRLHDLTMLFVRFDSEDHAFRSALRLDAYYIKNWIFDEISTEPILQDFVTKAFGAKRAKDVYAKMRGGH